MLIGDASVAFVHARLHGLCFVESWAEDRMGAENFGQLMEKLQPWGRLYGNDGGGDDRDPKGSAGMVMD